MSVFLFISGQFASLDQVFLYDEIYQTLMSTILFARILYFLAPLEVNSQLYVMRRTLLRSQGELISTGTIMGVAVVAFTGFFYLFEGPAFENFKTSKVLYALL